MLVFVLDTSSRLEARITQAQLAFAAPDWPVIFIEDGIGHRLNKELASYNDTFFMILHAGDRIDAIFLNELKGKLDHIPATCAGVFLHHHSKRSSTLKPTKRPVAPIIWRTAAVKQGGTDYFSEKEWLPFEQYVMQEKFIQLNDAWEWMHMQSDHWIPSASKIPGWMRSDEEWQAIEPILQAKLPSKNTAAHPLISIVICTYNDADYLPWAIRSVYAQSNDEWELLIVDDGSDDHTGHVLGTFERDNRIHLIKNESNQGKAGSLNQALRQIRGQWLLELDADDWLAPDCLQIMIEYVKMASSSTALIHGNYYEWYDRRQQQIIYRGERKMPPIFEKNEFLRTALPLAPRLYRADALRQIDGWSKEDPSQGHLYEDFEIVIRLSKQYQIQHVPKPLYHRRLRRTSITHQNYAQFLNWREWMDRQ